MAIDGRRSRVVGDTCRKGEARACFKTGIKMGGGIMRKGTLFLAVFFVLLLSSNAFAHCQMPCGIYDDAMRFSMIREDIATIETAINTITAMEQTDNKDFNQITRWVMNKEAYAGYIQEIVADYFMTQRIKAPAEQKGKAYDKYVTEITLLHRMLVAAMKTKQSTEMKNVDDLKKLTDEFEKVYMQK